MPEPLDASALAPHPIELFGIGVTLVVAFVVVVAVVRGLNRWNRDNAAPVQTQVVRVVAKRTDVSGGGGDRRTHTGYFATFESPTGERVELAVPGREFGLLAEGDVGSLTSQGSRFTGFARTSIASQ